MDKRHVIYYSDELNDEFSRAEITPITIDENYRYDRTGGFSGIVRFILYRIVATPLAFLYTKLVLHHRTENRKLLRPYRKTGYFMYGNHTSNFGDPLMPNMFAYPKDVYFVVHPNNVSMPVLGKINRYIGAMPLPGNIAAAKNFKACMEKQIKGGNCVVIYPEAHIWPYYTKIRPFPDTSFAYPVKLDVPVFSFTNTYQKRRFFRKPKIVTYIDGPFFPDVALNPSVRKKALRDQVYETMCERAKKSDVEYIKYVKKEA
ncbi:MAG: 1-acyl-sn-glycerol-3-phosphate acyltransferase [Clostridia bacterium]|nr:1-acyl-sn-glycerol-3-phosphate acyltransferase [Clostridia bacterium]